MEIPSFHDQYLASLKSCLRNMHSCTSCSPKCMSGGKRKSATCGVSIDERGTTPADRLAVCFVEFQVIIDRFDVMRRVISLPKMNTYARLRC
uniref:Uncharacterized protein n=1 Tax=Parascaris univalens TaxID=6257 RepID=A0A915AK24_PARUN